MQDPTEPSHILTGGVACLCGEITLPISSLASQTIPLTETVTCHCNPCRYVMGTLLPIFTWLKAAPPAEVVSKLKAYAFTDRCKRHHCVICGSVILVELPKIAKWAVSVGCIDVQHSSDEVVRGNNSSTDVSTRVKIKSHGYVNDTIDGGMVPLLLGLGLDGTSQEALDVVGVSVPLFGVGHSGEANAISRQDALAMVQAATQVSVSNSEERLEARCHCGGVNLLLQRAGNTGEADSKVVEGESRSKWNGRLCACPSCRLATGAVLQGWVLVSQEAIIDISTGQPLKLEASDHGRAGGSESRSKLQLFRSSQETLRGFCDGCGATALMHRTGESGKVAISAGILRALSGAMAREWVEWSKA